jgi:hypothetical protein
MKLPELRNNCQIFTSINLARCDLTELIFEQVSNDKYLSEILTSGIEYLDLSGNSIKLNSDFNFYLSKLLLGSNQTLKYLDLSTVNLEDSSDSEGGTFVRNISTIICSFAKLEILSLCNISWQFTYLLDLYSNSLTEIKLSYNCLDVYSMAFWILNRNKFKNLRKMDLSY